jgi:hypothetical protein
MQETISRNLTPEKAQDSGCFLKRRVGCSIKNRLIPGLESVLGFEAVHFLLSTILTPSMLSRDVDNE